MGHAARSIVGDSPGRPKDDFYPTPRHVTEALFAEEDFVGSVWEPACGAGDMCRVIEENDLRVVASDITDRGWPGTRIFDFQRTVSMTPCVDNIISNPPYNIATEFARLAVERARDKVALLLKLQFLEGQKRSEWLRMSPLARVHVFSRRIKLGREGKTYKSGGMIAFAWFVWEHGYHGQPQIHWI